MNEMKEIIAAVTACKGADFELQPLKIRQPKGDEVLVPNPGYPTYSAAVKLAGGVVRHI